LALYATLVDVDKTTHQVKLKNNLILENRDDYFKLISHDGFSTNFGNRFPNN
jgi:hypothetical protein